MFLPAIPQTWTPINELIPREVRQGWGGLQFDRSVQGHPLTIASRSYKTGLGTHAESSITYYIAGRYLRFQAWVGIDAEMKDYPKASVDFQVFVDGKKKFDSGTMHPADAAKPVDADVTGAIELRLVVTDAGDGIYADHADWADPRLLSTSNRDGEPSRWAGPHLKVGRLQLHFVDTAGSMSATLDQSQYMIRNGVEGSIPIGRPIATTRNGSVVVTQNCRAGTHKLRQTQTLRRNGTAVDWTVTIEGDGKPWSAPIDTSIDSTAAAKIWMPAGRGPKWEDPLEFWPAKREIFAYGKRFDRPNGICLPLASLASKNSPEALTLVMSPEDHLLAMDAATSPTGVNFSRTLHRIEKGRPITFRMHLVPTQADSRSALAWMVDHYRPYFDPPNRLADQVGGLGAYSGNEEQPDAAKLHAMGFRVNWKASIDFPYMGMFLPPVAPDEKWNRFAGGGGGSYGPGDEGRYGQTSLQELEQYNRMMHTAGFRVLNYFNATEFGGNITYPPPDDLGELTWKDPERFLFHAFPSAILKDPGPTWTWGGAVILDCADPGYRQFLLDQAKAHLKYLPSTDGICIDRTDWLERVNIHADDGMTWSRNAPARSLINSWKGLLNELGPTMHRAGKVIFINDLIRRLDIMRQVDGIYDEFGYDGGDLNSTAFLCLRKPHIAWTAEENQLKPDPDAFFQRHLYMGAFPTAPLKGNDHTILPSKWADEQYLAYGSLFNALEGRKWLLQPGLVRTSAGKANVFSTPDGYVAPIVFCGKASSATVRLDRRLLPPRRMVFVRCPGEASWQPVQPSRNGSITLPVRRGCAVLRIVVRGDQPSE